MPTSRPGSEPAEFWVDGSRRDRTVEEFYTLSSELGRFVPPELGRTCHVDVLCCEVDHSFRTRISKSSAT